MRFVTFFNSNQQERVGLIDQSIVIDALEALRWLKKERASTNSIEPTSMLHLIQNSDQILPALKQILQLSIESKIPQEFLFPENQVHISAPIPKPVSMRDGYAFRQHVETARRNRGLPMIPEFDRFPVFYFTNHLAVTGPGKVQVQKRALDKLDFELEVAVVIGKQGKNIPASRADEYIFGYTIMNDWSARTLQMEEMTLSLGPAKGKDFATSLGPYLVTQDELESFQIKSEFGKKYDLKMKAFLNGKQLSDGSLKDMNWTFAQIIERASYGVTLYPGEVIGSGTVGTGCLLELNGSKITDNLWLKPNDEIILEVEGLGKLKNQIVEASEDLK